MRICVVSDLYYPYPGGVSEHVHHTVCGLRKLGHEVTILTTNFEGNGDTLAGTPFPPTPTLLRKDKKLMPLRTLLSRNDRTDFKVGANTRVRPYTGGEEEGNIVRVGRAMPRPTNKSMGIIPFGFGLGKKIKEVILDGNFDIIHMHGMSPFLPLLAVRYSKSANILTLHGSSPEIKSYKYIAYLLQSYIKKADGVIAVSFEALKTVERFIGETHTITPIKGNPNRHRDSPLVPHIDLFAGLLHRYDETDFKVGANTRVRPYTMGFISGKFVNVRYAIIPNGIDTDRFSPSVLPISKLKEGGPNILFVGRFEPRKGLKYLLQAFPKVCNKFPSARLVVVGKGFNKLKTQNSKLKNVYFEGYVSAEDIPRYYAGCDVFCSPATCRESFGIVLLEAMSSGKPVIASNIPGYREVVTNGEDGLLVESENPDALACSLVEVLGNKELSGRLSKQGRETALRYSWDRVTREIEKFYVEVKRVKEFKS